MADPRFFERQGPLPLDKILAISGAVLPDGQSADPSRRFVDVKALSEATAEDISFLDNRKYVDAFKVTSAGACFVSPDLAEACPAGTLALITDVPYRAYAKTAQAFYPGDGAEPGISGQSVIDPTATLGAGCRVAAGAVIAAGALIGANTVIESNAVIGRNVVIGTDCFIGAGASLSHCLIGNAVKLYPGVRIGQDGFGFHMSQEGHLRVPQLGRVIIEDDVEIGANATVDRGAGPDTIIRRGVRIDNLVMIAHNVEVGPGSVVVAQSGVSGSTKIGAFAILAAQSGLTGHLKIGNGAQIGAQSGVMRDVGDGERVMGSPAMPSKQFFRQLASLKKLAETGSQKVRATMARPTKPQNDA